MPNNRRHTPTENEWGGTPSIPTGVVRRLSAILFPASALRFSGVRIRFSGSVGFIQKKRNFAPSFSTLPPAAAPTGKWAGRKGLILVNLVLDIGNTRSKVGIFDDQRLVEQAIWGDWTLEELSSYGNQAGADHVIFSSVSVPDPALQEKLAERFVSALELTHETPLPFRNAYRTPQTLGKDRLAGVAGAQALFPGRPCLVVDCGTCIKYEVLSADGVYVGGNIAPGAQMRIRAMHTFTARLPEVPMHMPEGAIGSSTETALQNGALRGAVLEIEGFARLFAQDGEDLILLITGGDAAFFLPYLQLPNVHHEPHLTLHGLNHILQFNAPQRFQP
ncbi:MAG: type III pantothenate kinase [Saprospiraceae bacterium]|nr:type III pantothenate kinase [Saprospiraceae bacterium]